MSLVQKSNKIIGLFLVLFLMVSLIAPVSIFGAVPEFSTGGDKWITASTIPTGSVSEDDIQNAIKLANQSLGAGDDPVLGVKINGSYYALLRTKSGKIEINKTTWNEAKNSDVSRSMREFVNVVSEDDSLDADAIQTIMTGIQECDSDVSTIMLPLVFEETQADMYTAYKITSPFLNLLSIVLGVGAVCLIILLLFSTVMDLAYIGLPVWREAQQGKNQGKNPFGVSYEALRTVQEVEKGLGGGDGEYRNAYLLYFKRRALTYIILAICIMYLICGGLSGIIAFVLQLVSGITG